MTDDRDVSVVMIDIVYYGFQSQPDIVIRFSAGRSQVQGVMPLAGHRDYLLVNSFKRGAFPVAEPSLAQQRVKFDRSLAGQSLRGVEAARQVAGDDPVK